jgi:hypothetical protein
MARSAGTDVCDMEPPAADLVAATRAHRTARRTARRATAAFGLAALYVGYGGVRALLEGGDTRFGFVSYWLFVWTVIVAVVVLRPLWRRVARARFVAHEAAAVDDGVPARHLTFDGQVEPPRRW